MLFVSIDTGPQSFCHSFIALPKITLFEVRKSAVQVCQVTTGVMETTHLTLSGFKILAYELRIV